MRSEPSPKRNPTIKEALAASRKVGGPDVASALKALLNEDLADGAAPTQEDLQYLASRVGTYRCTNCGHILPITLVSYAKHTAGIFVWQQETIIAVVCQDCNKRLFQECTSYCAVAGWWGVGSLLFGNPLCIIANVITYYRTKKRFRDARSGIII